MFINHNSIRQDYGRYNAKKREGMVYHSLTPKTAVLGAVLEKQKLHPGKTVCPYALSHRGSRLRVSAKGVGDRLSDTKPDGYAKRSRTKPAVSGAVPGAASECSGNRSAAGGTAACPGVKHSRKIDYN